MGDLGVLTRYCGLIRGLMEMSYCIHPTAAPWPIHKVYLILY